MSKLTTKRLREIIMDSLYREAEIPGHDRSKPPEDAKRGIGVMRKMAFHPERVEKYRTEIKEMISELNPTFFEGKSGGGWSFLNLAFDKNDRQWGEQPDCDDLICISSALGLCEFPLPRETWKFLPGGMPYVVFKNETK